MTPPYFAWWGIAFCYEILVCVSYSKTIDHRFFFSAKTGVLPKMNIVFFIPSSLVFRLRHCKRYLLVILNVVTSLTCRHLIMGFPWKYGLHYLPFHSLVCQYGPYEYDSFTFPLGFVCICSWTGLMISPVRLAVFCMAFKLLSGESLNITNFVWPLSLSYKNIFYNCLQYYAWFFP